MNTTVIEVINVSLYISISILLMITLKDKLLSKYTETFKYLLCIGIAIRGIFIFKINITMPKFLESLMDIKGKVLNIDNTVLNQSLHINTLEIAFCIWFIGVVITSIYYINYNFKLHKKIHSLKVEVSENNMYSILENHKNNLEIKKEIKIYKLNGIYSPMLVGITNPKIVIPNRDYNQNDLNYIFRHELIHYKRKDNILKTLLIFLNIIHWFNPLVYMFTKYFDDQCELSCDELVINRLSFNEVKEYSMLLLDTMKYKNKLESSMCVSYLSSNKSNIIKNRIEGVLSSDKRRKGNMIIKLLFILSFVSVLSIDSNVYADTGMIGKYSDTSKEINLTKDLNSEYIKAMIDKYGVYQISIGDKMYSFSKAKGVK